MKLQATTLLLLALPALSAQAQYLKTHDVSVSVGGMGQFSTVFTSNPTDVTTTAPFLPAGTYAVTVTQQHHATTDSAGGLATLQFHPVSWSGVELNYGFTHYQERFGFYYANTSTPGALQQVRIPTDAHEATGAYLFHVRRIPFQPFMAIGGGAVDFDPRNVSATNQWRGAGLAELSFDLPVHWTHIGFRVEGRSLFYRSPNFYNSAISNRSWRATSEPVLSAYYRF
jgi:hypothetical protein